MEPWIYTPAADIDQHLLAEALLSPRTGHADLRPAVDRRRRGPRLVAMLPSPLHHRSKSYSQIRIVCACRESCQPPRCPVHACCHAPAKTASHLLGGGFGLLFLYPGIGGRLMAVLTVNALPFDREVHVRQSLRLCRQLLANDTGNTLVLFPQGSRSTNGQLGAFKHGIGLLVAGTQIPVIPCFLSGTHPALPKNAAIPRPLKIRLNIGPAISFKDYMPTQGPPSPIRPPASSTAPTPSSRRPMSPLASR